MSTNLKKLIRKTFGFTLVELIVVITILVILGTIAFTSLAGYSGSARDSSRISDMANISKGLDITYAKTNSYPMPDSYFTVTYSGGAVWYQGEVGTTVMNILTSAGAKLSKQPPTDPLVTTAKYTYSKVAYAKDSYQLKANWEGDKIAYISPSPSGRGLGGGFVNQAQAASGNPTIAYIAGNYNGVVAKTQTGTMTYILAVPSIISNTGSIGLILAIDSAQKSLSGALLTNGGSNTTGVTYNPVVAYASGSLPSTTTEKTALATGIATAYSGTSLASVSTIQPYIVAYAANDTATLASLGGSAGSSVGGSNISTPASVVLQYPGCTAPDILVGGRYWAACNVGATTPSTSYVSGANDSTIGTEATHGKYFQWGEDVAWDYDGGIGSADNCGWNRDSQSCGGSTLSAWSDIVSDMTSDGVDRWNDWSITDARGPCAQGYHVPTQTEWATVATIFGNDRDILASILKLPMAGYRDNSIGSLFNQSMHGYYWSSSPSATNGSYLFFSSLNINSSIYLTRSVGLSIRCIKN